jgi:hypothetical protein
MPQLAIISQQAGSDFCDSPLAATVWIAIEYRYSILYSQAVFIYKNTTQMPPPRLGICCRVPCTRSKFSTGSHVHVCRRTASSHRHHIHTLYYSTCYEWRSRPCIRHVSSETDGGPKAALSEAGGPESGSAITSQQQARVGLHRRTVHRPTQYYDVAGCIEYTGALRIHVGNSLCVV